MKTKVELLAELEQAQKRIAELENALASTKNASEFPKDPVLKELLTFEKRFTALFRSNPIPVGFTRASDFRIVDVNDAWSTLTGYTREEALGHTSTELGLAKPKTLQHVRDMLQDTGEIRQNEILLYTRAGQERQVLISSEPIEIDGEAYFLNNLLDVTEQRLAEQKLRESEAVFRAFIDQSHDGIMLSDEQGRIIEWNPALAQISGLERNQTLGMNAWDIQFQMMTPEKRSQITVEQLKAAMLNVMKEEHHPKFNAPGEFEIQTPQGERKFLAQTSFPIFSPVGYRLGAIVRDITARKQADEKLRESESRFATAFFTNPAPQSILSLVTGQVLEVNEATCRLFGYIREELIGAEPGTLNLWAEPAEQLAALEELKSSGHVLPRVVTIRKKSGETCSIIFTAEQITWKAEPCLITSSLDITERKGAEQKVLASETLLRQVMESTQDSIFAIDRDYRLLLNNQRHQQVLVETGGHPFHVGESVLPPNYPQDVIEQWRGLYDRAFNGEEFKWESEWTYTDGQQHVIESNFSPLRDAAGNITGALVVIHDITEHKLSENMLERAHNTLEQAQKIAHMGSFEYIAATQTTVWSEEEFRIYGLDPTDPSPAYEEMLQKMIHPEDADLLHDVFTKAMQNKSVYELEHRIVQPDGSIRWVHDRAAPYLNEEGQLERYIGVTLDVTDRKKAEQKLRESEENYRGLMESLDSVVATIDHNGRFLYMNEIAARVLGDVPENLIGKTMKEIFPEPMATQQLEGVRWVIREGMGRVSENITLVHGEPRWFRNSLQPIHNEKGQVVYALLNSTDVHELKSTQQELAKLNRTLEERIKNATAEIQDLYDNAPAGYHSLDANGYFLQINQTQLNWLGYSRNEVIGHPFSNFVTEKSLATFKETFEAFKQHGWLQDLEIEFLRKDRTTFYALVNAAAIKDENGNYLMSRSTVFDITARKQADEALKASETKYRQLFENMNEGFSLQEIITDENGQPVDFRYLDANSVFERHAGISPQKVIGKTVREVFLQVDPRSIQNYGRVALTGEPITMEYFSSLVNRHLSVRAFSPKRGQFATIFEDITERKQAEEKLNESYARLDFANHELKRAMHAKDEFLANMSHELRTPLNAIIGLSESMLEISANDFTPRQQKYLHTIQESGQHLLDMINDILDLAKAGAEQLKLETHTVDIDTVCQASLRMVKQLAAAKNIDVNFNIDQEIDSVNADERRLKQMIVNLLTNAVKFTPSGGKIGLKVYGDKLNQQVWFTVWDTGIGILKEDQARLFRPFVQVNSSRVRDVGGTGLGLALVAEMARLHGGTVSLESEPGKGSRFSFTLPWSDLPGAVGSSKKTGQTGSLTFPSKNTPEKKQTILLVEDTETAVMPARDYLEAKGYHVVVAQNGQEGINIASQIKPDLILMDVQMPVMDGLEAMRRLRAQAEFRDTPIIALTAYAMDEDRERCLAAGATDYVSKPYKLRLLVQKIEGLLK